MMDGLVQEVGRRRSSATSGTVQYQDSGVLGALGQTAAPPVARGLGSVPASVIHHHQQQEELSVRETAWR